MLKKIMAAVLVAFAAWSAAPANAAGYPEKPVKIVFPNAAGSGYHVLLLALTNKLKNFVPQPIEVVPMPGAGTATGTRYVASQPPDGYTLLFIHEAALQTSALGMLGFNVLDKFEPLVRTNTNSPVLYTRGDAPYSNIAELVAYAKAHPGEVRAAINTGALSHIEFIALQDTLGIKLRLVHVGGGSAGFRQALLAGDVDLMHANAKDAPAMLKAGTFKTLAYYGAERSPALPDTPTLKEQGYDTPGPIGNHGYLWIRKDAPEAVKQFWRDAFKKVTGDPATQAELSKKLGMDIGYLAGPALDSLVQKLYVERAKYIKDAGLLKNKK